MVGADSIGCGAGCMWTVISSGFCTIISGSVGSETIVEAVEESVSVTVIGEDEVVVVVVVVVVVMVGISEVMKAVIEGEEGAGESVSAVITGDSAGLVSSK